MKLKTYNKTNTLVGAKKSLPHVSICITSGIIKFSPRFIELAEFTEGEKVGLSQDQDNKSDWFVSSDKEGFELIKKGGSKRSLNVPLGFSSKDLARRLLEVTEFRNDKATIVMLMDTVNPLKMNGITYHRIATKTARYPKQLK